MLEIDKEKRKAKRIKPITGTSLCFAHRLDHLQGIWIIIQQKIIQNCPPLVSEHLILFVYPVSVMDPCPIFQVRKMRAIF
jgi:hypothetical protein